MASRLEQQSAAAAAVAATRGTAAGLLNRSELTTKSQLRYGAQWDEPRECDTNFPN